MSYESRNQGPGLRTTLWPITGRAAADLDPGDLGVARPYGGNGHGSSCMGAPPRFSLSDGRPRAQLDC